MTSVWVALKSSHMLETSLGSPVLSMERRCAAAATAIARVWRAAACDASSRTRIAFVAMDHRSMCEGWCDEAAAATGVGG
jgi:hypothetical protein